jgi:hypothetical protein
MVKVVAQWRVNLPSQPVVQGQIFPHLPLSLDVAVVLLGLGVDGVAAALGVTVGKAEQEIRAGVAGAERASCAKRELPIVVG